MKKEKFSVKFNRANQKLEDAVSDFISVQLSEGYNLSTVIYNVDNTVNNELRWQLCQYNDDQVRRLFGIIIATQNSQDDHKIVDARKRVVSALESWIDTSNEYYKNKVE